MELSSILTTLADAIREPAWQIPIAPKQCWDTSDDGQWTCPKHVEYFIKYEGWNFNSGNYLFTTDTK